MGGVEDRLIFLGGGVTLPEMQMGSPVALASVIALPADFLMQWLIVFTPAVMSATLKRKPLVAMSSVHLLEKKTLLQHWFQFK